MQGHPCALVSTGQCHHLPYWAPQNAVSCALTFNTEHLPLGLFMSVDASCVIWEFQISHSAEVTLQTVTCLCFAGLQKSREAWEQPSKLGASKWCFIWLLIRTIPSYLRDRNNDAGSELSNEIGGKVSIERLSRDAKGVGDLPILQCLLKVI